MKKIYKYTLGAPVTYYDIVDRNIIFHNDWLDINLSNVTIPVGYSWDGCSPKLKIFDHIIGTSDGKDNETKFASLIHDVLYQFQPNGISRKQIDLIFYKELKKANWKYSLTYYNAVRRFGWIAWYSKL